jgi:hypothetical protein
MIINTFFVFAIKFCFRVTGMTTNGQLGTCQQSSNSMQLTCVASSSTQQCQQSGQACTVFTMQAPNGAPGVCQASNTNPSSLTCVQSTSSNSWYENFCC